MKATACKTAEDLTPANIIHPSPHSTHEHTFKRFPSSGLSNRTGGFLCWRFSKPA